MRTRKFFRITGFVVAGALLLCIGAVALSTLSNLGLPTRSNTPDRLSELDKAHLAEVSHLRQTLGAQVWPGWEKADIPILVYNEGYAFLVNYSNPPDGWLKVPSGEKRGGPWEAVPGDTFQGTVYYRQRLPDPEITPEAFTVQIGDRWVASFQTREYAQISLISGIRESLPSFLRAIFPYRVMWRLLMGDTETYIGTLEHEAFHAYQGIASPERLAEAESSVQVDSQYPWENPALEDAWQTELNLLYEAARADTKDDAAVLAREFLAQRDQRRAANGLEPEYIDLEQRREWEEGLAKYVELEIQRQAALTEDYIPEPGMNKDPDFKDYATRLRYWSNQLSEVNRMSNRKEDTRFYYSGFAQATLLDRLMPGWKEQALEPDIWLEDLLRQAVQ